MAVTVSKNMGITLEVAAALPDGIAKYIQNIKVAHDLMNNEHLVHLETKFGNAIKLRVPAYWWGAAGYGGRDKLLIDGIRNANFEVDLLTSDNTTVMLVGGPSNGGLVAYTGPSYTVPVFDTEANGVLAETSKFRVDQYNLEFVATKSMRCRIYLHPTVPKENVVDLFCMCLDEFSWGLLIPHYNAIRRWL